MLHLQKIPHRFQNNPESTLLIPTCIVRIDKLDAKKKPALGRLYLHFYSTHAAR